MSRGAVCLCLCCSTHELRTCKLTGASECVHTGVKFLLIPHLCRVQALQAALQRIQQGLAPGRRGVAWDLQQRQQQQQCMAQSGQHWGCAQPAVRQAKCCSRSAAAPAHSTRHTAHSTWPTAHGPGRAAPGACLVGRRVTMALLGRMCNGSCMQQSQCNRCLEFACGAGRACKGPRRRCARKYTILGKRPTLK